MVKALNPTDVNVQSTQQIVDAIGFNFGKLDDALVHNPAMRQLLGETWKYIQQLERVNHELDAVVAGAQAALVEMARQRDIAVTEVKGLQRAGDEFAKRILARQIAYDGHIPLKDVMLVLEVLSGDKTTFEEPRLEDLLDAIRDLGNALVEEHLYESASRENEKEAED